MKNGLFELWNPITFERTKIGQFEIPEDEEIQPEIQLTGDKFTHGGYTSDRFVMFRTNFFGYKFNIITGEILSCRYPPDTKIWYLKNGFTLTWDGFKLQLYRVGDTRIHYISLNEPIIHFDDYSDDEKGHVLYKTKSGTYLWYLNTLEEFEFECDITDVIIHSNSSTIYDSEEGKLNIYFDNFPVKGILLDNKILKPGKGCIFVWLLDDKTYDISSETDAEVAASKLRKEQEDLKKQ